MCNIDTIKFRMLVLKWKDPKHTSDINKLSSLADVTIEAINKDPLLKDICEIFLYAISTKAMCDPNFHDVQKFPERSIK